MLGYIFSLSIANLSALLMLPLVGLLVLAYLRRKPDQRKIASSLLLLRILPRKRSLRRRFQPPPRFFLELAALLLLMLAAASPFEKPSGKRIAVLLDNTLSMRALERSGEQNVPRMTLALAQARSYIGKNRGAVYSLYTSSPKLTPVLTEGSGASADAALSDLSATFSSDDLAASVVELGESGKFDTIAVFTDKEVEYLSPLGESESLGDLVPATVLVEHVGRPVPNISLSNFWSSRQSERAGERQLNASISLSGSIPLDVELRLSGLRLNSETLGLSSQALASQKQRIFPAQTAQVSFSLSSESDEVSLYKVELVLAGDSQENNALLEDDSAWLAHTSLGTFDVLLVSPDAKPDSRLGLGLIPGLSVSTSTPEEFSALTEESLAKYSLLIFHKSAPVNFPPTSSLFIVPPAANSFFPVSQEVSRPPVTSWSSSHPFTTYLRLQLLRPEAAVVFDAPFWAQSIINSQFGSLLLAGEYRGIRLAAVGFEILPFEGTNTPLASVLMLNMLDWLSAGRGIGGQLLTGGSLRLEGGFDWEVRDPHYNPSLVDTKDGKPNFVDLSLPGPYVLSRGSSHPVQIVAANAFFPGESTTASPESFQIAKTVFSSEKLEAKKRPLWHVLALAAFLLMLLEPLLLYIDRSKKLQEAPA